MSTIQKLLSSYFLIHTRGYSLQSAHLSRCIEFYRSSIPSRDCEVKTPFPMHDAVVAGSVPKIPSGSSFLCRYAYACILNSKCRNPKTDPDSQNAAGKMQSKARLLFLALMCCVVTSSRSGFMNICFVVCTFRPYNKRGTCRAPRVKLRLLLASRNVS